MKAKKVADPICTDWMILEEGAVLLQDAVVRHCEIVNSHSPSDAHCSSVGSCCCW